MKRLIPFLLLPLFASIGCRSRDTSGGPIERAGRAVDNAVYNVGTGVKRTGQSIQNAAD